MSFSSSPFSPHFGGEAATNRASQKLLRPRQLIAALKRDDDPYLGTLPPAFLDGKLSQPEALKVLDGLADDLIRQQVPETFTRPELSGMKGQLLGRGLFGAAYRVSLNGQDFAFKIFLPAPRNKIPPRLMETLNRLFHQGAHAEPAMGLYFTAQKTPDVAIFHAANPSARWQLIEYVDPDAEAPPPRPGTPLAEQGYMFQDSNRDTNSIHGIRIDYGGWLRQGLPGRCLQTLMTTINTLFHR